MPRCGRRWRLASRRAGDAAGHAPPRLRPFLRLCMSQLPSLAIPLRLQMPVDVDSFLLVGRKAVKTVGGRTVSGVIRMWRPTFGAGQQHGEAAWGCCAAALLLGLVLWM